MSLLVSVLAVCLAAISPDAPTAIPTAASTSAAPYSGTFRFAGGHTQRDGVVQAVERAVQALLPVFHELARRRLTAANVIPGSVSMSMDGDDLVVVYGDLEPQRAPLDGTVRTWHNREGTKVKLKHELRGNTLVQTSWSGGGRRVMVWSLDDEGERLRMHSTMSSPHLPVSIEYRLTFAR